MEMSEHITCPGCGIVGGVDEGETHHYMTSSPFCWKVYGDILGKEYQDPAYMAHHRFTVDAYALQHPGTKNAQSIQSVNIHLLALHLIFAKDMEIAKVLSFMQSISQKTKNNIIAFEWLSPPKTQSGLTVEDVIKADTAEAHGKIVHSWARDVYDIWHGYHHVAEAHFKAELAA